MAITTYTTAIFRRTGTSSFHQHDGRLGIDVCRNLFYKLYLVYPTVSEIVFPLYFAAYSCQKITYCIFAGILAKIHKSILVWHDIIIVFALDELIQMIAIPPYGTNKDFTQMIQCKV